MKKSLLLIDICCILLVLASCHNTTTLNHKKINDTSHVTSIAPAASDTSKISGETPVLGSVGNDQGKIKDIHSN
ncbi:MAG TPA: hypothetical protein PKW80_04150 [Bacteroidales bacterium]|nr:hypothetical protein [Bacteroidales bacterium]